MAHRVTLWRNYSSARRARAAALRRTNGREPIAPITLPAAPHARHGGERLPPPTIAAQESRRVRPAALLLCLEDLRARQLAAIRERIMYALVNVTPEDVESARCMDARAEPKLAEQR